MLCPPSDVVLRSQLRCNSIIWVLRFYKTPNASPNIHPLETLQTRPPPLISLVAQTNQVLLFWPGIIQDDKYQARLFSFFHPSGEVVCSSDITPCTTSKSIARCVFCWHHVVISEHHVKLSHAVPLDVHVVARYCFEKMLRIIFARVRRGAMKTSSKIGNFAVSFKNMNEECAR